ncbi:MAG: polysaccharide export protein EpsE [Pseudomonadota bacterium]
MLAALLARPALAAEGPDYLIGAGDIIRVNVFQNPELSLETRVGETGTISYPLIGAIPVGGLAIPAAERKIADMLREGGFVVQPQVNIMLMQVRGSQVAVLGQVGRPGRFPLEMANTKLTDMLATAGGIAPGGADTLVLTGVRAGKPMRMEIDVPTMLLNGNFEQDILLQGGDIIYVHRAPMFYIYGEIQRPGSYRVERDMTLRHALAQAGGISLRGTERGLRLYRRDAQGRMVLQEDPNHDTSVRADDVIYIRESLF